MIDFRRFYSIRYLGRHCCLKVNLRGQLIVMRLWGEDLSLTFKSQLFFRKGHHVEPKEKVLTMSSFHPDNICLTFSGFQPVTPRTRGDHSMVVFFSRNRNFVFNHASSLIYLAWLGIERRPYCFHSGQGM